MPLQELHINPNQELFFPQDKCPNELRYENLKTYSDLKSGSSNKRTKRTLKKIKTPKQTSAEKCESWLNLFNSDTEEPKQKEAKIVKDSNIDKENNIESDSDIEPEIISEKVRDNSSIIISKRVKLNKPDTTILENFKKFDDLFEDESSVKDQFKEENPFVNVTYRKRKCNVQSRGIFDENFDIETESEYGNENIVTKKAKSIIKKKENTKKIIKRVDNKNKTKAYLKMEEDLKDYEQWCKEYQEVKDYKLIVEAVDSDY